MPEDGATHGLDPELATLVEPFDQYNRALIDNVHPVDWTNPEPPNVARRVLRCTCHRSSSSIPIRYW